MAQRKIQWSDRNLPLKISNFLTKTTEEEAYEEEGGRNLLSLRIASLLRR